MSAPRGRSKIVRLARQRLAPFGFAYVGRDGRDHHVFRADDGRVVRLPSSPRDADYALYRAVKEAGRPPSAPLRFPKSPLAEENK